MSSQSSRSKIGQFPRTFWVANCIELLERWAWYGFFMLFANYLTSSSDLGGLEFTQAQKGTIMGVGTGILYFLPVVTGAIADRFGYKKVLAVAFAVYASAFVLLPQFHSFTGVFLMYIYLALGAALFKPIVSATVAKTTNDSNSSIGFGVFYMIVNIGAFIGPMVALLFKDRSEMIFYISAGTILLNYILLLFYKEPGREDGKMEKVPLADSLKAIFVNMATIFKDFKFVIFLLIIAGFWTMYNQLFFTLPVFVSQWVDTSSLYNFFVQHAPFFSNNYSPEPGVMDAEFITNVDALYIIIFQVLVSSIVMKFKPLRSMMGGFLLCSLGMALTLFTRNVFFLIAVIFVFSVGEMAGSPKITEYIGLIAPHDKKALYMGYSFIPVFIGNILAGVISGGVYQKIADKVELAHRYVADNGLSIPDGLSSNAYIEQAASASGMNVSDFTQVLWDTYSPSNMWMVIFGIGLAAVVALFIYDKAITRTK